MAGAEQQTASQAGQSQAVSADSVVKEVCEKILAGDFASAGRIARRKFSEHDKPLLQAASLVDQYMLLQSQRELLRKKTYEEESAKLQQLRIKYTGRGPADANSISEVFAAVARVREYTEEDQKKSLLEDPFVQNIIRIAKEKAAQMEDKGEWLDAYSVCYYWLAFLFEDNPEYKKHAEELLDKAQIEISLQDDNCDLTSKQRHEGIKPEMFLRAVKVLNLNYVTTVDYSQMAQKALRQCLILAEVLEKSANRMPETAVADAKTGTSAPPAAPDTKKTGDITTPHPQAGIPASSGLDDMRPVIIRYPRQPAYKTTPQQAQNWTKGIKTIISNLGAGSQNSVTKEKFEGIFDEVLALNRTTLELPEAVIVAQFAEASFSALDPFTTIVWPRQVEDFEKSVTGQFFGIGVEISKIAGKLRVASLLPDTPAYNSGLDADDEILEVNGESTEEMTIFCAVNKITGPDGTKVKLRVRHAGDNKVEDITITRGRIIVLPLRGWLRQTDGSWQYMIDTDNKIGYIRMTAFTENSSPDLDNVLRQLEKQGVRAVILDLRFNSGGFLASAAAVVDLFIESGLIVRSQPRWGVSSYEVAHKAGTHPNYPLVVLINEYSASASEIVAGALQDAKYKRAMLIGERSYGKGAVQAIVSYTGGGSQLKYTMAFYHLPSDQEVKNRYLAEKEGKKDWGIAPDIEVKLRPNEIRRMFDVQRANEVLTKSTHDNGSAPVQRYSLKETLKSDPQLAVALLAVKAQIIKSGAAIAIDYQPLLTAEAAKKQ